MENTFNSVMTEHSLTCQRQLEVMYRVVLRLHQINPDNPEQFKRVLFENNSGSILIYIDGVKVATIDKEFESLYTEGAFKLTQTYHIHEHLIAK